MDTFVVFLNLRYPHINVDYVYFTTSLFPNANVMTLQERVYQILCEDYENRTVGFSNASLQVLTKIEATISTDTLTNRNEAAELDMLMSKSFFLVTQTINNGLDVNSVLKYLKLPVL